MEKGSVQKEFMTVNDVARYVRVKAKTVYSWTSSRSIPFYKVGGLIRFERSEIDAWLSAQRRHPEEALFRANKILKKLKRPSAEIEKIVRKAIDGSKTRQIYSDPRKSDRIEGLGKEV